ncbi:LCP family protein [Oceanobacillus bengalensis]|uniref:LytR family transcriptional regulator n=1 Tax=Oceanobacillus bengalensis TaxID=1435466 RepID=A0A494YRD2_9BACI|nr:LCP family protein [Oceanobacillus bengalensis]RKQ11769.1 LytR family transcriptional regulator [Oceanobacillus bengalensis]
MRDDFFNHSSDSKLTFTKEDRDKVFEQINRTENDKMQKKPFISFSKRIAYFAASLVAVGLSILLFIPSIFSGNINYEENNGTNPNGAVVQKDENFTALLAIKDENQRIPLNLLLTYNKDKNRMKVLSIPRDTYVPISDNDGTNDKLTHAYAYGSEGAESVKTTVSNFFDIPIDYYAVIDLKTFSTMIDSVDGINYDIEEDIRVRAISQAAFDLEQGTNHLNGEEVVALMMDATYGRSMGEEDLVNLLNAVINKVKNEIQQTELEEITREIEGNVPIDQLFMNEMEIPSLQSVSLIDGMKSVTIDGAFYFKIEKEFLSDVSEELTTWN